MSDNDFTLSNSSLIVSTPDGTPIVTFNNDGTITVHFPDKLDETARQFIQIIRHYWLEIYQGER